MGTTSKKKRLPDFKSNRFLKRLYNELNADYFDNKLPRTMKVIWSEDIEYNLVAKTMWRRNIEGVMEPFEIRIPIRLQKLYLQKQVGMTMVHEMNHIKCGFDVNCEEMDGEFDKSMFDLCAKGAFQTFW